MSAALCCGGGCCCCCCCCGKNEGNWRNDTIAGSNVVQSDDKLPNPKNKKKIIKKIERNLGFEKENYLIYCVVVVVVHSTVVVDNLTCVDSNYLIVAVVVAVVAVVEMIVYHFPS